MILAELLVGAIYFVGAGGMVALILALVLWGEDYGD